MPDLPNWFEEGSDVDRGSRKERAERLEKELADRFSDLGGMKQPASGALWGAKGDVKIGKLALGDCKSTENKGIRVSKDMWEKIKKETFESGQDMPFLQLCIKDTEPLIVISEDDFKMLLEVLFDYINNKKEGDK